MRWAVVLSVFVVSCGNLERTRTGPLPSGGDEDLATGISEDGGAPPNCGVQQFMLVKGGTPDLLIIQDRSISMADDANDMSLPGLKDPKSKWMQTVPAIEQAVQNVTAIDWGLMMFATDGLCAAPTKPDVAVGAATGAAIKSALDTAEPDSLTPTTATINAAVSYFKGLSNGHDHYLLVATDGEPNCGTGTSPYTEATLAEMAVTDAANAGIHTFVVGVGGTVDADKTLAQMALNGKEPNTAPGQKAYYSVSTTSDLITVLSGITGKIVSCTYALTMPPTNPNLVTIQGNGALVPRDTSHMNGWDYGAGNLSIVFYGAACASLQQGVVTKVEAIYECPPPA